MIARTIAAMLAVATLATGCVIVPTGSTSAVGRKASLDKVMLAMALPEDTDLATYRGGTPWNRARLTVSRLDGGAPDLVQPLEGVKGGLKAKAPLKNLDPGAPYRMDIELIYDEPGGLERVVARGVAGEDEDNAVELKPGTNSLEIPVGPTVKGDRVALEPLVVKKSSSGDDDDDFSFKFGSGTSASTGSDDTTVVGETSEADVLATVIGVVGAAVIAGMLDDDDEDDEKKPVAKTK
jgi:hypothetical protein